MKPNRNEQMAAALLAVSVALVLLASVDFLAQYQGQARVELASVAAPAADAAVAARA
jgi:hypothetical protein